MKKIFQIVFTLISISAFGQAKYNPIQPPGMTFVINKPIAPSGRFSIDYRSVKGDTVNFIYRPYNGTAEVLTYLDTNYRYGWFPIVVNVGGSLQSNGRFIGGQIQLYWFRNGVADSNLVVWNTDVLNTSGFLLAANNLNDLVNASVARNNLGLGTMATQSTSASGDLSGTWPSITVAKLNGQLPAFYLNYNNLTNKPTIPAQFNPIAGTNMSLTGTYPNIVFNSSGGGTPCLNCNADSIQMLPVDISGLRDGYVLAVDSTNGKFQLVPNGSGGSGLTALTQDVTATGSGSQPATVVGIRTVGIPTLSVGNLKYNGTAFVWDNSAASAITALTGDVTASGPGSATATIANNAVTTAKVANNQITYAKIQQASTGSVLLGAQSAGNLQEIGLGAGISMTGGVLNATGTGLSQIFSKNNAINILGTDTVQADTSNVISTIIGLNDSIYQKDPYTWDTTIVSPLSDSATIPAYRQDAPSIIRMSNGNLLCLWAGFPTTSVGDNSASNIVGSISTDNGKTWSTPSIKINGSISNLSHVSTPSMWVQSNGNIIAIINVKNQYAAVPIPHTGTNLYRYLSTDNGATFTLQDSLIASVTRYGGVTNHRIVQSQTTKRLFMPYLEQTTISAHYRVRYFYSDNDGTSWTLSSNIITPADTAANEPGVFILQNKAPLDTAGSAEKIYFFFADGLGSLFYSYSTDNGATVSSIYTLGVNTMNSVAALVSINNETQVVGLVNRYMVNCCATQSGQRKKMDLVTSSDAVNWQDIGTIQGKDSGYHYFEPALSWDSAHGYLIAADSRMNDAQTRSDIRFLRIPTRTVLAPVSNNPIGPLTIGMDVATLNNGWPGLVIYNRNIDNLVNGPLAINGFTSFNTVSGGSFWPGTVFRATTDGPLGVFNQAWVGQDANSQYYSAGYNFIVHPHSGSGGVSTIPLAKFTNNATPVFTIGPNGNTGIGIAHNTSSMLTLPASTTTVAPLLLTNSAGTNISSPTDGMFWYNGTNLNFRNGSTTIDLLSPTSTNIYNSDGPINTNRQVSGNGHTMDFGTSGSPFTTLSMRSSGDAILNAAGTLSLYGTPQFNGLGSTSSDLTIGAGYGIVVLTQLLANHTVTISPNASGDMIHIYNQNNGSFSWTFATTVKDLLGNTVTAIPNGISYTLVNINSTWTIVNSSNFNGGLIKYQHSIFTPSTGGTVNLVNNQYNIINPSGSLVALTVNLPSSPLNNDVVYIKYTQAITTVTYGNGTVVDGITTPTAGGLVVLTYDSGSTSWY